MSWLVHRRWRGWYEQLPAVQAQPVDTAGLLRSARAEAQLSQGRLADLAGTARTTVVRYEAGIQSPTVRQLDRLLAACGLRARVLLEPLTASADALLDAAATAPPPAVLGGLPRLVASLEGGAVHPITQRPLGGTCPPVTWAMDGSTAVCLQGLLLPHDTLELVLLDDDGARRWLSRVQARGLDPDGFSLAPHWSEPSELAQVYLRRPVYTLVDFLQIRLVQALGPVVTVVGTFRDACGAADLTSDADAAPDADADADATDTGADEAELTTVRALSLLAVEREQPALAEVLARFRTRPRPLTLRPDDRRDEQAGTGSRQARFRR